MVVILLGGEEGKKPGGSFSIYDALLWQDSLFCFLQISFWQDYLQISPWWIIYLSFLSRAQTVWVAKR